MYCTCFSETLSRAGDEVLIVRRVGAVGFVEAGETVGMRIPRGKRRGRGTQRSSRAAAVGLWFFDRSIPTTPSPGDFPRRPAAASGAGPESGSPRGGHPYWRPATSTLEARNSVYFLRAA